MPDTKPMVLFVDPDTGTRTVVANLLASQAEVRLADGAIAAEPVLETSEPALILASQSLPERTGVGFLTRCRERRPDALRILIADAAHADGGLDGIERADLYQLLINPWHPIALQQTVRNACELHALRSLRSTRGAGTPSSDPPRERDESLPDASLARPAMAKGKRACRMDAVVRAPASPLEAICDQLALVAPFDIPVLLTGESGTGKELFARALHHNSPRAERPFVAENCGALPDQLLESELFGHRKGAFTGAIADHVGLFEQADGGTVFLDEIGDVSPAFQVKLLRVLQEREIRPIGSDRRQRVDVRVVAATNRDLEQALRDGSFRPDLYYRLAGVSLHLPPLRERPGDIPAICERILDQAARAFGLEPKRLTDEALVLLQRHQWSGNIRELQNELQRILLLGAGEDRLGAHLLSAKLLHGGAVAEPSLPGSKTLKERVEALEAGILCETLTRCQWNKSRAATELGLSRVGLRRKLERYGLSQASPDRGSPD